MAEQTIYVILCKMLNTGMNPYAAEARLDRYEARERAVELTKQNPGYLFYVEKTKLIS